MVGDEAFDAWAKQNIARSEKDEKPKERYADVIERVAITIAIGNNGGEWNINYTEDQRMVWRGRAKAIVRFVIDGVYDQLGSQLNNYLVEMKPGFDDSITGFNEAWDIVRKIKEGL